MAGGLCLQYGKTQRTSTAQPYTVPLFKTFSKTYLVLSSACMDTYKEYDRATTMVDYTTKQFRVKYQGGTSQFNSILWIALGVI